jgi:acetyl-CoA carboxylase biotin carboxyl carrier protein
MRRAGRLHAPELEALATSPPPRPGPPPPGPPPPPGDDRGLIELRAPAPGVFVPSIVQGDLVTAGSPIGELVVLGRAIGLIAPRRAAGAGGTAAAGLVVRLAATGSRAVGYGDVLVALDPSLSRSADPSSEATAATAPAVGGLVFRAPTSGRFYGRSAPDKPPFVTAGAQLTHGATICLLEVMKTFHRVTYGSAGLPDTARIRSVLVADGDDVNAGDPLLALE